MPTRAVCVVRPPVPCNCMRVTRCSLVRSKELSVWRFGQQPAAFGCFWAAFVVFCVARTCLRPARALCDFLCARPPALGIYGYADASLVAWCVDARPDRRVCVWWRLGILPPPMQYEYMNDHFQTTTRDSEDLLTEAGSSEVRGATAVESMAAHHRDEFAKLPALPNRNEVTARTR